MPEEDWRKIKAIVGQLLDCNPAERQELLARAKLTPEMQTEVESLLACEGAAENFLTLPALTISRDFFAAEELDAALPGSQIGNYRILRELGLGGMGAVYLAERSDGKFAQKVAVKMLKREFNSETLRRNFTREKDIQAKLNHPNIARLLDAGTTADGVPFLVLEYIEGLPVDKFCAGRNLPLNARLKLFNKVCETVSFSHRNLIIHRDLKPSNILVTEDGEPKLLDFGIAKLFGGEVSGDKTTLTLLGALTPQYASPEQIKGEPVTTATDVYSLGVILFKLLTGTHPFNVAGKTNGELLKTISEDEPTTPSLAIAPPAHPPSAIRNPQLQGDLDNIILKALCKEPERRYPTVEQFSADIWRFIDGLPVLARPATFSYRASKFYQRNKVSVIAGIVVFLALVMGITAALWQARVARKQVNVALEAQRRSERETEHAKAEEEKAKKITAYMSKVFPTPTINGMPKARSLRAKRRSLRRWMI